MGDCARRSRFGSIVQKGMAIARPELGHSVHVEVSGLEPGRDYWYRFRAGGEVSRVGPHRHRAARRCAVDRLRFAVCGCSHYEQGYFTAFRRIAEEHFDFVFHTGDYIYEGRAEPAEPIASGSTTARRSTRSSTIATATRSTSPTATSSRPTRRRRSS